MPQATLSLFKADIDSAYRRIPIKPEHREFAHILFKADGKMFGSGHIGMPFGSVASVHNWDRVGELSCVRRCVFSILCLCQAVC